MKTVHDFAGELIDRHIAFTSGGERMAWFPAWENADRDLPHLNPLDIPIGSIDEPFEDFDDAWRITIYDDEGFVYVFEADHPLATTNWGERRRNLLGRFGGDGETASEGVEIAQTSVLSS